MQGTKLNRNSNNVASFSSQTLFDTPSRQIPKTTSAIAGDAFGTEAKLQTLQYQATQTRYSLFLAQAQTGRSDGSFYVVKPKTFNDKGKRSIWCGIRTIFKLRFNETLPPSGYKAKNEKSKANRKKQEKKYKTKETASFRSGNFDRAKV